MKKSLSLFLFSLLPLCGGELLRNGGFEKPGFPDFRFRRISKSPLCQVERSSVKVKNTDLPDGANRKTSDRTWMMTSPTM